MTDRNLGRWLLVALATVGLAFAVPAVSAHGDEPMQGNETAVDGMSADGATADWAAWMDGHMTDHVGPGAADAMGWHRGATVDDVAQDTADHDHATAGMNGQGRGC